jgi:hypothetical protein
MERAHWSAQGTCASGAVGARELTGVADPTAVCRVLSPTVAAGMPGLPGRDEATGWLVRAGQRAKRGLAAGAGGRCYEPGVADSRWRWQAPGGVFPSERLVDFLSRRSGP